MQIDLILFYAGLFGLVAASIMDLRTREVADWLNYGLIFAGFGLRLMDTVAGNSYSIVAGILGFLGFFAVALVMFYSGQWGGGDAKMMMGLGVIYATIPELIAPKLGSMPFLVVFLINILLVGGIYGLIWSIFFTFRDFSRFSADFSRILKEKRVEQARRWMIIFVLSMIFISVLYLMKDTTTSVLMFGLSIFLFFTFYVWVSVKAIEQASMHKSVLPERLTEGDWIAKDIFVKNHRHYDLRRYLLMKNKETLANPPLNFRIRWIGKAPLLQLIFDFQFLDSRIRKQILSAYRNRFIMKIEQEMFRKTGIMGLGRLSRSKDKEINSYLRTNYGFSLREIRIAGPGDLGIEKHQIEQLIELNKRRLIHKVEIKEGIPFVPSFFFAFLATAIWGNIFLFL